MALVRGKNALCYIGGSQVPEGNEWSVDVEQEKIEAPHTFVCPSTSGADWTEREGGFFDASGSISGLYDDADQSPIDAALSDTKQEVILYPSCDDVAHYWIGDAWIDVSQTVNVDEYATIDVSFESTGQWQWAS